jgi:hypothetical protein
LIIQRILAATDGTEASLRGVLAAAQLVEEIPAEFVLLTAVPVQQHMVLTANMDERSIHQYLERTAQEVLTSALAVLRREGVGAEVKVVYGPPPRPSSRRSRPAGRTSSSWGAAAGPNRRTSSWGAPATALPAT